MTPNAPSQPPPTYEELAARLKEAEARLLSMERLLMQYVAHDRSHLRARHEVEKGQPLLDLAGGQAPAAASDEGEEDDDEEPPPYAPSHRKKKRRGRRHFPAHLPRETKEYNVNPAEDLPDYDPAKGHQIIDHDSCEELVVPRREPKVIVHRRPVVLYTTTDGETRLATVGGMSKVFPKCAASPEVLTQIAVDRLHNQMTLYRIARSFGELGCPLSRSTLANWMIWLGKLLAPLARAQEEELQKSFKRHVDDTVVRVQAPDICDEVRVWVVIAAVPGGGEEILFRYTEARTAATAYAILGRHEGYLQVDACNAYDDLYQRNKKLIEVGCWSHVFRKFDDLVGVDNRVKPMLRLIRGLYAADSYGKDLPAEERRLFRLLAVKPWLQRIGNWVTAQRQTEVLESSFKKALNYVSNQWAALKRFLEDGRLSLDNNISEAEFHVFGVGRRNYLFWGSREGLASNLVLMGLIRSCVANKIDPYQYLLDVIRRVATTQTPARLLIPSRWRELPPLPVETRQPAAHAAATPETG